MRLHHLALAVQDRERSIAFYARYFRFDPASARTYPDGVVIVRDPDGFALALGVDETAPRRSGFPHFGFDVDSPQEARDLRARMNAEGVELVEDEDAEAYVGFKCLDPDGHVVEVSWEW
jgi:catechol 2,3-dioxygenase-like lactoylglutathione lyase family enzyme